jgi:hypothetical protein
VDCAATADAVAETRHQTVERPLFHAPNIKAQIKAIQAVAEMLVLRWEDLLAEVATAKLSECNRSTTGTRKVIESVGREPPFG